MIERSAAELALRGAAFTDDEGRSTIHTFSGNTILLGADWDLDDALAFVARSERIAWVVHPLGHNLAVHADGRIIYFDVKEPDG